MSKQDLSEKKFINELLQDKDIKIFLDEYLIKEEEFDTYLETFMAFYIKKNLCKNCKGLSNCQQTRHGLIPLLVKDGNYIDIDYVECDFLEAKNSKNIKNLHLYNTSFVNLEDSVFVNVERKEVLAFVKRFLETYESTPNQMGLYLYGSYGNGKSYIMGNLAKELAKKGIDVAFVYYPDFVRQIKQMVTTGGINTIVNELKKVPVLFLDDFGGESNTNFIRDEVLLPILQYRMINKKPLFVTSNLSDKEIIDHLSESNREIDVQKALRVFERLRSLMVFKQLKDKNYR